MKLSDKKVIILFGPPGAGKGTQAELLSDKLSLYRFESSKIIENKIMKAKEGDYELINGKKYSLLKEKDLWLSGILNTPAVVTVWFKRKIKELAKEGAGIVMEGSPRTLYEVERMAPFLKRLYGIENIKIILIRVSAKASVSRNPRRRICELGRHPILYTKETIKLTACPIDGSRLLKRKGLDDPETIKTRLKEYSKRTTPIFEYLKEHGFSIREVNGERSPGDVFEDVLKAIK